MSKITKKQKTQEEIEKEAKKTWIELSGVIKFLEKKGLEINECQFMKGRTEFVRGKKFEESLINNLSEVCTQINKIMDTNISPENQKKAIQEIYDIFKSYNIISKACRQEGDKKKHVKVLLPYEQMVIMNGCNCGKDHENEELDHKPKLDLEELKLFDPTFFYTLNIHRGKSMIYIYLTLVIVAILIYELNPLWPTWFRYAIWWVSYILLLFIIGLLLVRFGVYLFFYIFGYDIWLFPDLNDEKLGFFESFYRIISVDKRSEKWYTICIRLSLALISGYIAFYIYKNPNSIEEGKKLIKEALKDFYSFGEDKFVNAWNTTAIQMKQKKTKSYQEIDDLI